MYHHVEHDLMHQLKSRSKLRTPYNKNYHRLFNIRSVLWRGDKEEVLEDVLHKQTAAPGQGEVNLGIETEVETCHERVKHMKVRQENLLTLS